MSHKKQARFIREQSTHRAALGDVFDVVEAYGRAASGEHMGAKRWDEDLENGTLILDN